MLYLRQLAYVSRIEPGTTRADERQILGIAKRNNRRAGLTGILASSGTHFLQVLEGSSGAIDELLGVLETDPRHSGMRVLFDRTVHVRRYASWSMGYVYSLDLAEALASLHKDGSSIQPDDVLGRINAEDLSDSVFGFPSGFGRLGARDAS